MASATHLLARSDHSHLHGNGDLNDDDDGNEAESSSDSLCESEFIPYREDGEIEKGGGGGGGGEEEEDEEEEGEEEEEEDSEGEEFGHGFSISSSLSRCSSSNSIVIGSTSSDQSFGRGRTDQIDLDTDTLESCHWTDDKHRSYLTFMEENFVKEMFDGEYSKSHTPMGTTAQSQHKLNQFETRPTWRSILMEQCNIPPNMPWNFSQTPRVNHLRHIPTTHFQESAETKDADTHPSTRSLEGNKELEYMLMAPNDEAQERRICCNQSASSSMIDDASNSELEDLSEDPNFNTLEDQVILPRTQCSTSFVKPRKRSVVLVSDEWKISTRRKLHE